MPERVEILFGAAGRPSRRSYPDRARTLVLPVRTVASVTRRRVPEREAHRFGDMRRAMFVGAGCQFFPTLFASFSVLLLREPNSVGPVNDGVVLFPDPADNRHRCGLDAVEVGWLEA